MHRTDPSDIPMKRTILLSAIFLLLSLIPAKADKVLDSFSAKVAKSTVSFNYSYAVKGDMPLTGKGTGEVCENEFHVKGNGLDIWCDGKTRWMVDSASKEVIIEKVSDSEAYTVNPALFITDVAKSFNVVSANTATFKGKSYHCVALSPKVKSNITGVKLYFSGEDLRAATVTSKDGSTTEFELSGVSCSPTKKAFTYNVKALDKSWVITDLSF